MVGQVVVACSLCSMKNTLIPYAFFIAKIAMLYKWFSLVAKKHEIILCYQVYKLAVAGILSFKQCIANMSRRFRETVQDQK